MICVIHGYIEGGDDESGNIAVLDALPTHGALLIRPMFGLLPYSRSHAYYGHLIHFAAEYKECYCFDEDWLSAFEGLLQKLSWSSAQATLSWSEETRLWTASQASKAAASKDPIQSRVAYSCHESRQEVAW